MYFTLDVFLHYEGTLILFEEHGLYVVGVGFVEGV